MSSLVVCPRCGSQLGPPDDGRWPALAECPICQAEFAVDQAAIRQLPSVQQPKASSRQTRETLVADRPQEAQSQATNPEPGPTVSQGGAWATTLEQLLAELQSGSKRVATNARQPAVNVRSETELPVGAEQLPAANDWSASSTRDNEANDDGDGPHVPHAGGVRAETFDAEAPETLERPSREADASWNASPDVDGASHAAAIPLVESTLIVDLPSAQTAEEPLPDEQAPVEERQPDQATGEAASNGRVAEMADATQEQEETPLAGPRAVAAEIEALPESEGTNGSARSDEWAPQQSPADPHRGAAGGEPAVTPSATPAPAAEAPARDYSELAWLPGPSPASAGEESAIARLVQRLPPGWSAGRIVGIAAPVVVACAAAYLVWGRPEEADVPRAALADASSPALDVLANSNPSEAAGREKPTSPDASAALPSSDAEPSAASAFPADEEATSASKPAPATRMRLDRSVTPAAAQTPRTANAWPDEAEADRASRSGNPAAGVSPYSGYGARSRQWPTTPLAGLLRSVDYSTLDDLTSDIANASAAADRFVEGSLAEPQDVSAKGQAYMSLCRLTRALTLLQVQDMTPLVVQRQEEGRALLKAAAAAPGHRDALAQVATRWWEYRDRPSEGIFFISRVRDLRAVGRWTEYAMEIAWDGGSTTVPVLVEHMRLSTGDEAGVFGVVINDPARRVEGYQSQAAGEAADQLILAGHTWLLDAAMPPFSTPAANRRYSESSASR